MRDRGPRSLDWGHLNNWRSDEVAVCPRVEVGSRVESPVCWSGESWDCGVTLEECNKILREGWTLKE